MTETVCVPFTPTNLPGEGIKASAGIGDPETAVICPLPMRPPAGREGVNAALSGPTSNWITELRFLWAFALLPIREQCGPAGQGLACKSGDLGKTRTLPYASVSPLSLCLFRL